MRLVTIHADNSVTEFEVQVGGALGGHRCTEIALTAKDFRSLGNMPADALVEYMSHLHTKLEIPRGVSL